MDRECKIANTVFVLWIYISGKEIYFTQKKDAEMMCFSSNEQMIDFARACVDSGFLIG